MAETQELTSTTTFADVIRDFHEDTPCDSHNDMCTSRGGHPAQWLVLASCNCISHWCEERMKLYMLHIAKGTHMKCTYHIPTQHGVWARLVTKLKS